MKMGFCLVSFDAFMAEKLCSLRMFRIATPPLHGQGWLPVRSQESASVPGEKLASTLD